MEINKGYGFGIDKIDNNYVLTALFFDLDHIACVLKEDYEIRILSAYINVFPKDTEEDEHYTEKELSHLVLFSKLKSKVDSFYEYRIYEIKFFIPSEEIVVDIDDDDIVQFHTNSLDKSKEIAARCLDAIGYKDEIYLKLIIENFAHIVTMNKNGKHEIFKDIGDLMQNTSLLRN